MIGSRTRGAFAGTVGLDAQLSQPNPARIVLIHTMQRRFERLGGAATPNLSCRMVSPLVILRTAELLGRFEQYNEFPSASWVPMPPVGAFDLAGHSSRELAQRCRIFRLASNVAPWLTTRANAAAWSLPDGRASAACRLQST